MIVTVAVLPVFEVISYVTCNCFVIGFIDNCASYTSPVGPVGLTK